jgi:hypothetical protein
LGGSDQGSSALLGEKITEALLKKPYL